MKKKSSESNFDKMRALFCVDRKFKMDATIIYSFNYRKMKQHLKKIILTETKLYKNNYWMVAYKILNFCVEKEIKGSLHHRA